MGARERLIICVVGAVVVVIAAWLIAVSPERGKAANLVAAIATERQTLASEQSQVAAGRAARSDYPQEVHALEVLLDAIPTSDEQPQLIRLINSLENGHVIDWSQTSFAGASAAGFQGLDISFSFVASYANLQSFIAAIDALDRSDGSDIVTHGRLATVSSVQLSPAGGDQTTASVAMTVYMQPSSGATSASGAVTASAVGQ